MHVSASILTRSWRTFTVLLRRLRASFWLIPISLLVAALVLAALTLWLELRQDILNEATLLPGMSIEPSAARLILSTIASSMITVASLVFSLTFVALSLVAQQLGPRLVWMMMEDRPTQIMLGLFLATFLYAVMMLSAVRAEEPDFIPHLGILLTVILAIVAFISVIVFIHHIARQMQADVLVTTTAAKLRQSSMEFIAESEQDLMSFVEFDAFDAARSQVEQDGQVLALGRASGYVQSIDLATIAELARDNDLTVVLLCRPGHFILRDRPLMQVSGLQDESDLADELCSAVRMGPERTREQLVEFELLAIVEIALRALSPGINDPMTAVACLDRIAEALARFLRQYPEHGVAKCDDGRICLLDYPQTFTHFYESAIDPIAHAASGQPMVRQRIVFLVGELEALAQASAHRDFLSDQKSALTA